MKVFLDTNVLVSALATRGLCADLLRKVLTEHELLVGKQVLIECRRVLRSKFRLPKDLLDDIDQFLRAQTIVSKGAAGLDVTVRDPDDARIIAEAVAGSADVLVTGDRDLLDLAAHSPVRIVNPRGFWELSLVEQTHRQSL